MNTLSKSTFTVVTALGVAILVGFALSGCKSTGGGSVNRTHNMGGPKPSYPMSDESMGITH